MQEAHRQLLDRMQGIKTRRLQALEGLIPLAKAAVRILQDVGQASTARDITAQLFAIESLDEELSKMVDEDPMKMLDAIMLAIGPNKKPD